MKTKTIVVFNAKNARAAFRKNRVYLPPISIGGCKEITLEVETSETPIISDGEYDGSFVNTIVGSGTLSLTYISEEFEVAAGRKIKTDNGTIDIMQKTLPQFALLFENCSGDNEGTETVAKSICFFCTSPKAPSLKLSQNNSSGISPSTFDLQLKFSSEILKDLEGNNVKNPQGNDVWFWKETLVPSDKNYAEFGKTVEIPTGTKLIVV